MKFLPIVLIGLVATACGSAEIKTTADTTPPQTVVVTETTTAPAAAPATTEDAAAVAPATTEVPATSSDARIGDSITINGNEDGESASIKLVAVEKWTGDEFYQPDRGQALWTVRMQVKNVGTGILDECDTNMTTLVMNTDEEADASMGREPDLGCFKIRPGAKRIGWMTYSAPKGTKPATVQVALNSGYADETAEFKAR
jgi:hypothetical protein